MTTTLDRGAPRPEELGDAGSLLRQPQTIIWLKTSDQSFAIHKSLLTESSKYFQRCLDGPFAESQTNTIDLDDDSDDGEANVSISPLTLGTYVKLCYFTRLTAQRVKRSRRDAADHTEDSYEVSPFTLKPCDMHTPHDLTELVDMWSLCDRFHDDLLLGKVSTAIRETLDVGAKKLRDAHCAEWWVFNFANGYVALESLHRRDDDVEGLLERLKELFVQNCSPGSWERLAYQLPSEFVVATSIAFQRKMATLVANEAAITRVNGASLCYECKTRVQMALKR
ncbi:kelch-like protein 30-like protein [Colletotrichum incanum]|uniref:Kelch-like protein 30-like protein n=1 Tax=Colletotrichum incanum TaxID=1573173 RepID=A0A166T2U1_COLIC|nr:kelch-like protein 30-like protein [Colletotrichum incanum]